MSELATTNGHEQQRGFEFEGRFYPIRVSDSGKDLMLIDLFGRCSIAEFFDLLDDVTVDNGRAPIILTLIATSLRAGNPDWSVERIHRLVLDLNLSDVTWIGTDEEDEEPDPASAGTGSTGGSSAPESKRTSSAPVPARSATSNATPD